MVVLDTNVIIDHLRQIPKKRQHSCLEQVIAANPDINFSISIITIQELYEGKSTKDAQKVQDLLDTIKPLTVLPYTYDTAQLAGEIARDLDKAIEFADAAIAATAILNNSQLCTFNIKDFINIPNLRLYQSIKQ